MSALAIFCWMTVGALVGVFAYAAGYERGTVEASSVNDGIDWR